MLKIFLSPVPLASNLYIYKEKFEESYRKDKDDI